MGHVGGFLVQFIKQVKRGFIFLPKPGMTRIELVAQDESQALITFSHARVPYGYAVGGPLTAAFSSKREEFFSAVYGFILPQLSG